MKLALCLEQTLGHRAHTRNLEQATCGMNGATIVRVDYRERGRLPVPWTVRGSMDACRALRQRPAADVTFFHTQSVGLFAGLATRGKTYAISVDATPIQMDAMGESYGHRRQPALVEVAKRSLYRRVLQRAALVVAWSNWARDSLVLDYGVRPNRVEVIHPGASPAFFQISRAIPARPTILFVGGDFERKGGPLLLEAFASLRDRADLVLVTSSPIESRARSTGCARCHARERGACRCLRTSRYLLFADVWRLHICRNRGGNGGRLASRHYGRRF